MRRRIRLTGRKQIARAHVPAKIIELGGKRILTLTLPEASIFEKFPKDARVLGVLREMKLIELVEFGTLGNMKHSVELKNPFFARPMFQLRIVSTKGEQLGLLFGSTDYWSPATSGETGVGRKGILYFQPKAIGPRAWQLDIRDDDYPVVYIDDRIPDAATWATSDPTFVAFVFPAIVTMVFDDILRSKSEPDAEWMKDWIKWADAIMPGAPPPYGAEMRECREWTDRLIDSFSRQHKLSDRVVSKLVTLGDAE